MKNKLTTLLEEMSNTDLIRIHNDYCAEVNGWDSHIYTMDELNEELHGTSPDEVARLIFYGSFNPNHEYFVFNGYGNLESFNEWQVNEYVFISDIVRHIAERDDDLGNDEIRSLLDEAEEDDE